MFDECAERIAVSTNDDPQPCLQLGDDRVVPIGQHPFHDVLEALRGRQHLTGQAGVTGVVSRMTLIGRIERATFIVDVRTLPGRETARAAEAVVSALDRLADV